MSIFVRFKHNLASLFNFFSDDKNKHWVKWIDRLITASLLVVLILQIYDLPINTILRALPTNPLFYLIWLFLFFLVPISEYYIYKLKWTYSGKEAVKGFMLKKIYNNELYNYTGELYFINWISSYLNIGKTEAALFIKDNNVISSLVSSVLAFLIIGFLWFFGFFDASRLLEGSNYVINTLVFVVLAIVVGVLIKFKDKLLHTEKKLSIRLFWAYSWRFILRHIVLVFMWFAAAPEVDLIIWLNFLFIKIMLDRLPVGNRSMIFLTMAPWLSESFSIGVETFTGIQIAVTLLDKVMSSISLVWAKKQVES